MPNQPSQTGVAGSLCQSQAAQRIARTNLAESERAVTSRSAAVHGKSLDGGLDGNRILDALLHQQSGEASDMRRRHGRALKAEVREDVEPGWPKLRRRYDSGVECVGEAKIVRLLKH